MYGTIARMRIKAGAEAMFEAQMQSMANSSLGDHGWISTMVYRSDDDPQEVWLVVMFESRESYHANAERPNQDVHYRLIRSCLESDPEWHDGEIVGQMPGGWIGRTRETEEALRAESS